MEGVSSYVGSVVLVRDRSRRILVGFVWEKRIIETVGNWGLNPHAPTKFFSQERIEIGCYPRKGKKCGVTFESHEKAL